MQNKSAFTLVELIVSVTIISLLSAIGFQGFTAYLSSVRDTSRTAQLVKIYDTLVEKNIYGILPMPDDYIEITSNGKVIGYQGYVGEKVLSSLGLPDTIADPKDETYYSYYLSKNKKYSEVMAFLEEKRDGKEATFFDTITPSFKTEIDYQERYPVVYGNKLGILTTKSNQPIQAIKSIQLTGTLDILNTNEELVARLENDMWGSGSGSNLYQLEKLAKNGGKNCTADGMEIICKTMAEITQSNSTSCPVAPNPDSDFTFDSGINTITNYVGVSTDVIIPCQIGGIDVLYIGDNAFFNKNLNSATIPNSIINIGDNAFRFNQLTSIILPNNITNVGSRVFSHNKISNLSIPNNITSIGYLAFGYNELTSIEIPNSVTSLGEAAFMNNKLANVSIPNSISNIGDWAFTNNELTSINIPNSINNIGKDAFSNNKLENLNLPDSVITIGVNAFKSNQLLSVNIPNSVSTIGTDAFSWNQLLAINIPGSVTTIGSNAFNKNKLISSNINITCPLPIIGSSAFYYNGDSQTTQIPNPTVCTP